MVVSIIMLNNGKSKIMEVMLSDVVYGQVPSGR